MYAFVVLGLVCPYQAKRLAWGTSPKWPVLCRVGRKTTTQSVNQQCKHHLCSTSVLIAASSWTWLASSPPVFFFHLSQKTILWYKWHRFFISQMRFLLSPNQQCQSIDCSQAESFTGIFLFSSTTGLLKIGLLYSSAWYDHYANVNASHCKECAFIK